MSHVNNIFLFTTIYNTIYHLKRSHFSAFNLLWSEVTIKLNRLTKFFNSGVLTWSCYFRFFRSNDIQLLTFVRSPNKEKGVNCCFRDISNFSKLSFITRQKGTNLNYSVNQGSFKGVHSTFCNSFDYNIISTNSICLPNLWNRGTILRLTCDHSQWSAGAYETVPF